MGLKCGALGLNLTSANRVIIVDPWWNNTVEQQAFGRVWRYKQEKICHLVRIKSESPMDLKIAEMQASKSKEVDRALQDEGFMPTEIDDHNLRMLFKFEGKKPKGGMTTKETVVRFGLTQGGQSSEVVQAEATDQ
jgi:SNF2 family DNA or RNA helicase